MTKEEVSNLSQEINDISNNFENKPWAENAKLLKENFDINSLSTPNHYLETIDQLTEVVREARLLFIYSVLHKVCVEEGTLYPFETPYQAGMSYSAVMKKEGSFYLLDEDGDYSEILTSETFMRFIDDLYWELYE